MQGISTHPPLCCNEEEIEGLGLRNKEVQVLQKVLKSQLSENGPLEELKLAILVMGSNL
jgi:hypothetical protein